MNEIEILNRLDSMRDDMQGMRGSMTQIAEAITRLAVLEEKHQGIAATVGRLTSVIDSIEKRLYHAESAREVMLPFVDMVKKLSDEMTSLRLQEAVKSAKTEGQIQGATLIGKVFWTLLGGGITLIAASLFKLALPSISG